MAKSKKRNKVSVAVMFAFARGMDSPINGIGASPYVLCSEILEKHGHPRKAGEPARKHCIRLEHLIQHGARGHQKRPERRNYSGPYRPTVSDSFCAGGVRVESDAFLQTYEWRRVRMEALKKYGPVCQCCGASPSTGAVMNVDHIKPRKLFPQLALDVSNLQILCHECNHGKGNWDTTDWREYEDPPELIRLVRDIGFS